MPDRTGFSPDSQHVRDDSFFVLRDCRELFQRRLAEIVRESGISSPQVIAAFAREVGEAHDELASSAQQDGFEQTAGLTASRITLVGDDDLELDIRIGTIANHLKGNDRIDHWRAQLRYMTLLQRPKMTLENNPVGLEPICRGLWAICKESGDKLDQNLDRLDRLEEQLQAQLPEVYIELNALLESHRIEPAPAEVVQRSSGGMPSVGSGADATGTTGSNALATLQQAMRQQSGAPNLPPSEYATSKPTGAAGNTTLNASTRVMLNHLMERLRVLELQQMSGLSTGPADESAEHSPLRALRSKDLDLPLGQPAAIALDTLSLIFEAIFATPDLPDVVKAAIGRLQIPLLKLALLDASFFADPQHPARRLVNRMARAAIGLAQDTGRDHPVCVSLRKLADAVRTTLETSAGQLTPHLDELDTLIAERDQSLQAHAQPYVQLVLEHEAHAASITSAQDWLRKALGKTTEPAIASFLSDFWLRVMQAAYLDGGTAGTRWKECDATVVELLWSVQARPTAEERKQLLALIPSLLKRINAELDLLAVSPEQRSAFFNTCFDLQTAALRNRPGTPSTPTQASAESLMATFTPRSAGAMTAPPVQILERNGKLVQYLGLPTETRSLWRSGGSAWNEGDWISFYLPDGEHLCGRHCWQGSLSGTVLLFNTGWGYAVALAPSLLEQQLRSGQARVVTESALFDEAAERALSQLALR